MRKIDLKQHLGVNKIQTQNKQKTSQAVLKQYWWFVLFLLCFCVLLLFVVCVFVSLFSCFLCLFLLLVFAVFFLFLNLFDGCMCSVCVVSCCVLLACFFLFCYGVAVPCFVFVMAGVFWCLLSYFYLLYFV